jgi:predicted NAD/FAD-dependent oxidoreductase
MDGCWAAMLSFHEPIELPFDGAFVSESLLSWIARNDSKPERDGRWESWVLHASPQWTAQYIEEEAGNVLSKLIDAFWQATGAIPRTACHATVHKWRYAIPQKPLDNRCLFDHQLGIGACGDWCCGPRVEGAFLSGMAMAGCVLSASESK